MSENKCLITKLKAVVDNPNLKKFGILDVNLLHVSGDRTKSWIRLDPLEDVVVTLTGATWKSGLTIETFVKGETLGHIFKTDDPSGGNVLVSINSKYKVQMLAINGDSCEFVPVLASDIAYIPFYQSTISIGGGMIRVLVDTEEAARKVGAKLDTGNVYIPGIAEGDYDISLLKYCVNLTSLNVNGHSNVLGSINTLGALTKLNKLNLYNTKISGDYVTLINSQRSNGRTSGKMTVDANIGTSTVTFAGFEGGLGVGGSASLSWDENHIILYDYGVDSVGGGPENSRFIKCVGYTDEEIKVWTDAGIKVVKCD